jgi:hypothetical protein
MRSKETIKDRQQSNRVRELKSEIEVQGDKERKRESERYHYVRFIEREKERTLIFLGCSVKRSSMYSLI